MRTFSSKSLCVLVGLLVPALGTATQAQAGVIPWLYDSIFGYGWGGGHGYGYGGGMPYSVGYGGYGYGYGGGYAAPTYAAPVYSSPVISSPVGTPSIPADGTYKSYYGPGYDYYDPGYSASVGYGPVSGSCCDPCNACSTGDCATPVQSGKPATPTPADEVVPVNPKNKKQLPPDDMAPAKKGGPVRTDDVLPESERLPMRREPVAPDDLAVPVDEGTEQGPPPGTNEQGQVSPSDRNIASRVVPVPRRTRLAVPRSVARVVRVDRSVRDQLVNTPSQKQLAANP